MALQGSVGPFLREENIMWMKRGLGQYFAPVCPSQVETNAELDAVLFSPVPSCGRQAPESNGYSPLRD